jgi:hypothetical protein
MESHEMSARSWASVLALFAVSAALLLGLPLAGVASAGRPVGRYLEFPPRTQYVEHAPFSWTVFALAALVTISVVAPFAVRVARTRGASVPAAPSPRRFPAWGWMGVALGVASWGLAWTRFPWFAGLQAHTFSPLWLAYILVVNALTFRRAGDCLMRRHPRALALLFPVSAGFWWFFEYLNRFVQDWHYVDVAELTPFGYFWLATLPFATVLPAVMSTAEWLATFPQLTAGLHRFAPVRASHPRRLAAVVLALAAVGLVALGIWPDILFPLLWVAPLGIVAALLALAGRPTLFAAVAEGDWRRLVRLALAALVCGFFWEMWNVFSLARWAYAVPYVNRFHVFEMPLLGFTGYLPFGLECGLIADLVLGPRGEEPPACRAAAPRP